MAFDAGSIEAHLTITRDEFDKGLAQAKADADRATRDPVTFKITADGDEAKTTLDDLSARKDKAGKDTSFKVAADAAVAKSELDAVQAKKDKAGQDVSFKVRATDDASAGLAKVQAEKDRVGGDVTVKVKTDSDTSGLDDIGKKITELKDGPFSLLKTAIVGLGPATVPVAAGMVAAFLPLGAAIGSAAAGLGAFGVIVKQVVAPAEKATASVQKAQLAYNAAIAQGTKQASAFKTEQTAIAKAYQGMSAQQLALSDQLGALTAGWQGALKSVTPLVSSALIPWLKDIRDLLGYIKPLIGPIANDFAAWGTELGKFLNSNPGKLQDFFSLFGARSAGNIYALGNALVSFAKGAAALVSDIAPNLAGAASGVTDLAASFDTWAHSQRTADDIKGFFAWVHDNAPLVKQFLESLATSVGHLIQALAYSGGGDLRVLTIGLQAIAGLPPGAIVAIADAFVAISLGLRAATLAMGGWNVASTIAKGIQAALSDEIKVTGAALAIQKIALLAMAAADAVVDAAETIYIALMLAADAASLPLIVVIGAVVLAVAALAAGVFELVTHWSAAWHAILAAARDVYNWVKANWPLLLGILTGPVGLAVVEIAQHWTQIQNGAETVWNAIASYFTGWWSRVVASWSKNLDNAEKIFSTAWSAISSVVRSVWNAIASFFSSWWSVEVSGWSKVLNQVEGIFTSAWNTVSSGIRSAWNAIKSFFSGWWSDEISGWRAVISTFTGIFRNAWNTVESNAKSVWNAIRSFFSSWWSVQVNSWRGTISTVENIFRNAWNSIYSNVKSVWGNIKSWFGTFWSALENGFTKVIARIKSIWKGFQSDISAPVTWVINNVYDKYIVRFWNDVAGAVGLPKLPKLAEGGMVPGGYSRTDNQLAWLRSGEGVLQPGAVSALGGPGFINWANARYGDVPVSGPAPGHYAQGGLVPGWLHDVTSFLGSPIREVLSIGKTLEHAVDDGILAPFKAITRVMVNDLAKMPGPKGDGMVGIMRKMPLKMWDGFVNWVGNHLPFASSGSGGASGPGSAKGNAITQFAERYLGTPYVFGGTQPGLGWDCCIIGSMKVQTREGPKEIRNVCAGDVVYSWDGGKLAASRVTRRSEPRHQQTFRLRTLHREIIASGNHPFLTLRPGGFEPRHGSPGRPRRIWTTEWVNLEDLRRDDIIVALRKLPDDAPEPSDPLLADERFLWLLGLAFGDGSLSRARANRVDLCVFGDLRDEVQDRLEDFCGKRGSETDKHGVYLFSEPLASGLRRFGMDAGSTERVLPRELWTLPHDGVQAFLDGYTAADGHRLKRAGDPALNYKAANRGLIEDVRNLHMILGHNVTRVREMRRTRPIVIKGKEVRNARSLWTFEAYETGVKTSAASRDLLGNWGIAQMFPEGSRFAPQRVTSIEPMGTEDTYDITVEGTHNFVAEGLVVHNSGFTEFVYDHFGWTPPRTSEEQFGWVKRIATPVPGALAFFTGSPIDPPPGHVGIVTSPNTMIDAYGTGYGTIYNTIYGSSGTVMGFGIPPSGFKFDDGGWLQPGASLVVNSTGRPEPVLTGEQWGAVIGGGPATERLDMIIAHLSALVGATGAAPGAMASGLGAVLKGSARNAAFRNRYRTR